MKYLLACLLVLCPLAAEAQSPEAARSVSDCERIKNDLAYNQCLASFGPKRGERTAPAGAEDDGGAAVQPATRGGRSVRRSRGGRQAASFDVLSGRRGAAGSTGAATVRRGRGSRSRR